MNNEITEGLEDRIIEYAKSLKRPAITPFEIIARYYGWEMAHSQSVIYRPVLSVMNSMVSRDILHKAILSNNVSIYWLTEREKQP